MASAMLGGVAGNAGLFSNAEDLICIFQMLLNGGTWNGKQYKIRYHRSLYGVAKYQRTNEAGFHKPNRDFKGGPRQTMWAYPLLGTRDLQEQIWADPETQLIYVFLSNRCYPDAYNPNLVRQNIRTDIQNDIYERLFD